MYRWARGSGDAPSGSLAPGAGPAPLVLGLDHLSRVKREEVAHLAFAQTRSINPPADNARQRARVRQAGARIALFWGEAAQLGGRGPLTLSQGVSREGREQEGIQDTPARIALR